MDAAALTVPVANFVKHRAEIDSLEKSEMEKRFVKFPEVVDEKRIKE